VAKVRSLTELCDLRISETYIAPKGHLQCKRYQRFGHIQRYCGYAPRCVACGKADLPGECSTPQQQLKCCSCGGNYTANYRGCAKWKKAKAALAKRAPFVRSKMGSAPSPPVTPKAQRSEPTTEQVTLGQGWNHVVRRGRVIKAASPPSPNPTPSSVTPSPTRNVVETTGKKGKTAKSTPKFKVGPSDKRTNTRSQDSLRKLLPWNWWPPPESTIHPSRRSPISLTNSPSMHVWTSLAGSSHLSRSSPLEQLARGLYSKL